MAQEYPGIANMRQFGGLWEEVTTFSNLYRATGRAVRGAKRTAEVQEFLYDLEHELLLLKKELLTGTYSPSGYRTFTIHDPKRRVISAAPFRDRVLHHAVCDVIQPVLENIFSESSYACRKSKGTHRALKRATVLMRKNEYFLKCDVSKFFNSVDHSVLKKLLEQRFKEPELLSLFGRIIDEPVPGCECGKGLAIGNLTSQCFANLYLTGLDLMILHQLRPCGYIRYMDDFVLFGSDTDELHGFLYEITEFLNNKLKLALKPEATFVASANHGLPFLGMQLFRSTVRVNGKSLNRLNRKLRWRTSQYLLGEISEENYERSLSSIFGHLAHADTLGLRRTMCNNIPSV